MEKEKKEHENFFGLSRKQVIEYLGTMKDDEKEPPKERESKEKSAKTKNDDRTK